MRLIKKIYVSYLAYLILPLSIITLTIYIIGSSGYQKMIHDRNSLQLAHMVNWIEQEVADIQDTDFKLLVKDLYLPDGFLVIYNDQQEIALGDGELLSVLPWEQLRNLDFEQFKQGRILNGFYTYHAKTPLLAAEILYLMPKVQANGYHNRFKFALILVFFGLLMTALLFQRKTTSKVVEPIYHLYSRVWNIMDPQSKIKSQQLAEDELKVVQNYLTQLEDIVKDRDNRLRKNLFSVMDVLISLLEIKDSYTASHSRQVRKYSIAIAQMLNLEEQAIRDIAFAATLHDIGKIGVSHTILNKPGRLTIKEFAAIKQHPIVADEVLKNIEELETIRNIIRHHHEKYDGTGYPDRLKAQEIPFAARVVSVADAFDAMTSDRPYRKALHFERAIQILMEERGRQFDPVVVDALIQYLEEQNLVGSIPMMNEC